MGLTIGLGCVGNAGGGGGGVVASGLIQDMEGFSWTGTAQIKDTTITELTVADFRYCTNLDSLFYNCKSLASVGELKNTGKVTSASNMFYNCSALQTVPLFDTANVNYMNSMFYNCSSLQDVPALDTSKVTNMSYMFYNCISLQSVPEFDTAKATNMNSMFDRCISLKSIGGINLIKVTSDSKANYMFSNCISLVTANIANLGVNLDLSYCKALSIDSVLYLFNNAKSGVSGKTIQLNSLVFDQLTEEQIAIATQKGFSVSSVVRS